MLILGLLGVPTIARAAAGDAVSVDQIATGPDANRFDLRQDTAFETASASQQGLAEVAIINQSGGGHLAGIVQTGRGDRAAVDQSGAGETAKVLQTGDMAVSLVLQSGRLNTASVVQEAGAWSMIAQSGTGNITMVRQGRP